MNRSSFLIPVLLCFVLSLCRPAGVRTGLDILPEYRRYFEGKRIGIIANHTAVDSRGRGIISRFNAETSGRVTVLFAPEHGVSGRRLAGETVADSAGADHIAIVSLYGETLKPAPSMLNGLDILVFDIQDVGARFYTYLSTMTLAMEAAAESRIPFVVLDRPNPIGGLAVEGPLLEPEFASLTGLCPVPVRHGLTAGEMALMINGEGWLAEGIACSLIVVPVRGWDRRDYFDRTGLVWIRPSPNMPDLETALVYPGTCLLEGTNVSEGRGTLYPFRIIGAPWIKGDLSFKLNALQLPGVLFEPAVFTPRPIPAMSMDPKFRDAACLGVRINVTDRRIFKPFLTGLAVIKQIHDDYPQHFEWLAAHFDRLCGTGSVRRMIETGRPLREMEAEWALPLQAFCLKREKGLLYR